MVGRRAIRVVCPFVSFIHTQEGECWQAPSPLQTTGWDAQMFDESVSTTKSLLPVSSRTLVDCGGVPIRSVTVQRKPSLSNGESIDRLPRLVRDGGFLLTRSRWKATTAGLCCFSRTRASVTKKTRHAPMARKIDDLMMFYEAKLMQQDEMKNWRVKLRPLC